jgi:hypothetical protein
MEFNGLTPCLAFCFSAGRAPLGMQKCALTCLYKAYIKHIQNTYNKWLD